MLVQPLAIAISAIMAKIAIIAVMAMANGCTNMAMLDIHKSIKSTKKLANWS